MDDEARKFWNTYIIGEFYAALKRIADIERESDEWDGRDKFHEARDIASEVLAKFKERAQKSEET